MTINCKGELIDLSSPRVMGILNVTPDSFYDGGNYTDKKRIIDQVDKMLNEGATFIDIGAYSSRPGASFISEAEELDRLIPIVELVLKNFPDALISIDTFRSNVAEAAIKKGAALINDISAGQLDSKMFETIANHKVPYIMMHMRGTPQTMNTLTHYDDLLKEILKYFSERLQQTKALGITDTICDPGFGFAKTIEQNFELLNKLELFKIFELPLLVGLSRKSMIYKSLNTDANNALNGTSALHMVALQNGASILRVHDVKEAMECIALNNLLNQN